MGIERFEVVNCKLQSPRTSRQFVEVNDVCRLATLLAGSESPIMSKGIRIDMQRFMEAYELDPIDPKELKIKGIEAHQIVEVLRNVYLR